MAANEKSLSSGEIYAEPVDGIRELTIASNQICESGNNPYELRNSMILDEKKKKIRYKNGETLPNSAINLLNDANRKARHSRILGNNMLSADKSMTRPSDVDAHHVVASQEPRAKLSRRILFFIWVIAINDAANGVFMPRFKSSKVSGFSNCPPHQGAGNIHTDVYHISVFRRLDRISSKDAVAGRAMLRQIASEIVVGTFPY